MTYPKMMKWILPIALCLLLLIGCSTTTNEETLQPSGTAANIIDIEETSSDGEVETTADDEETERPVNWTEETHSKEADPNYEVVFPEDKVNQLVVTIEPEDWEAMQANMTELFGEAGSGDRMGRPEGDGNFPRPGNGNLPGDANGEQPMPPEGEPPTGDGNFPQPGDDNFQPPAEGERPEPPDGVQFGERPGGGGFGGGDMTPENPMWVEATIEFEGNTWEHVGIRYKGNSSLTSGWRSGTLKLPLKLDFDEFEDDYPEIDNQRFYGFKQLSLANGFSDTSFLRDAVTYDILEAAGLPAAETAFYEIILDYGEGQESLGLYTMIEVIDDTVVERTFGSDDGNIYEADGSAASFAASTYEQIEESFQKENNEDEADWSDIETLYEVLHSEERTTDPVAWRENLEAMFDVDNFLEWLAISAVIQHWDTYGAMSHNYYLYNDPETGQLSWISWDHNMAMSTGGGFGGDRDNGQGRGGPGGDRNVSLDKADVGENWPLIRNLLDDPVYYDMYLEYLAETIAESFNPDKMAEKYQTLADLIAPYAAADVGEEAFETAVQQLIDHAYQRTDEVASFLSSVE